MIVAKFIELKHIMHTADTILRWEPIPSEDEPIEWIVYIEQEKNKEVIAKARTREEALEAALSKLGFVVLDKADWPPGKIAHFKNSSNFVRNVAVLRTGLHSLYQEVRNLECKLPSDPNSCHDFDVNSIYAHLAVKFDWFSVSMLNLMEGVSLLDTLAREGNYEDFAFCKDGMEKIKSRAREYTKSIPEAKPLRAWRNKVASHRSGIHPPPGGKATDSLSTKIISLWGAQVKEQNGRYVAPGPILVGGEEQSAEPELIEWSLTKTWESLASKRYDWLNENNFFDAVNALSSGGGVQIHSFSVASGDDIIKEFFVKNGIELPEELR